MKQRVVVSPTRTTWIEVGEGLVPITTSGHWDWMDGWGIDAGQAKTDAHPTDGSSINVQLVMRIDNCAKMSWGVFFPSDSVRGKAIFHSHVPQGPLDHAFSQSVVTASQLPHCPSLPSLPSLPIIPTLWGLFLSNSVLGSNPVGHSFVVPIRANY